MRIAIVSSSRRSYASVFIQKSEFANTEFILILNNPKARKNIQLFKKIKKVGLGGAVIGYWFRRAYQFDFADSEQLCVEKKIRVIYTDNFKYQSDDWEQIASCDLGISMGNGYIPSTFFSLFKYGMINIHHEILPDYPGAQSVVWPLIEGRAETGFSIHRITKGIDKGELLMVRRRPIRFYSSLMQTVRENYRESLQISVDDLIELLKTNPEEWQFMPNTASKSYTTPSFFQWLKAFQNHRKLKKCEA